MNYDNTDKPDGKITMHDAAKNLICATQAVSDLYAQIDKAQAQARNAQRAFFLSLTAEMDSRLVVFVGGEPWVIEVDEDQAQCHRAKMA